jgi:hypothetical protein
VSHRAGGSRVRTVSPNLAGQPDTGLTQALAVLEAPEAMLDWNPSAEPAATRRFDDDLVARLDAGDLAG